MYRSLLLILIFSHIINAYYEIPESIDTLYKSFDRGKIRGAVIKSLIRIRIDFCLNSDILPIKQMDYYDSENPELIAHYLVNVNKTFAGVVIDTSITIEFRFLKNQVKSINGKYINYYRNSLKELIINSGKIVGKNYKSVFDRVFPAGTFFVMDITGSIEFLEDKTEIRYKAGNLFSEIDRFGKCYYKPLIIDSIYQKRRYLIEDLIKEYKGNIIRNKNEMSERVKNRQ